MAIQRGIETQAATNKKMKDDRIIFQKFTCCGKKLEKFLWEGWDWVDGDVIPEEILIQFKYCPFCGKLINEINN